MSVHKCANQTSSRSRDVDQLSAAGFLKAVRSCQINSGSLMISSVCHDRLVQFVADHRQHRLLVMVTVSCESFVGG